MVLESDEQTGPKRPSVQSAAVSPTALSILTFSAAMIACGLLPHSIDTRSNEPASAWLWWIRERQTDGPVLRWSVLWPYVFALCTFMCMALLVFARPKWFQRALLGLPLAFAAAMTVIWTLTLFSGAGGSRVAMVAAVVILPFAACVAARMIWLARIGEPLAAAAWGFSYFCVLAAFSLRWFWFQSVNQLQWGAVLSIACLLALMSASWCWRPRARHDLYDRSAAALPFQISLRQIIVGVTLAAIALTYWKVFRRLGM